MSLFDINILWDTINFLILLFLLKRFLFKPVKKVLDDRRARIEGDLQAAKTEQEKAKELRQEYEKKIANIEEEARQIIEDSYRHAREKKEEIISQAKEEARLEQERTRREVARIMAEARAQLRNELSSLTVLAAGRFLEKSMEDEEHQLLIQKIIEELPEEDLGARVC